MYRTHKTHELILKGLPEKYRGEMWMLFSGAQNEVRWLSKMCLLTRKPVFSPLQPQKMPGGLKYQI